jgi:hypothetical protein
VQPEQTGRGFGQTQRFRHYSLPDWVKAIRSGEADYTQAVAATRW